MNTVASIVEGDGEVTALPVLLRRVGRWQSPTALIQILPPIRVRRDRFINRDEEFNRHLLLAAAKCGESGWILILLDADDDCPVRLAAEMKQRARQVVPHRRVAVVLANREYEAWFIASAKSLNGQLGFQCAPDDWAVDAETPRNAKGWISKRIEDGGYHTVTDQPAFSARMDLEMVFEHSRSFRKLCSEWNKNTSTP